MVKMVRRLIDLTRDPRPRKSMSASYVSPYPQLWLKRLAAMLRRARDARSTCYARLARSFACLDDACQICSCASLRKSARPTVPRTEIALWPVHSPTRCLNGERQTSNGKRLDASMPLHIVSLQSEVADDDELPHTSLCC